MILLLDNYIRKIRYLKLSSNKLPPFLKNKKINRYSIDLYKYGITSIQPDILIKNLKILENLSDSINKLDLIKIKHEYFSQYTGEKNYKLSLIDYVENSLVEQVLKSKFITLMIEEYFNCKPKLTYSDLWLDIPTNDPEKFTQLYHRDYDHKFLVKVFIYINDVDIDTGPFCYIKKSHKNPWLLYKGKNRLNDDEITELYSVDDKVILTGKKNTMILADTNGFHKGLKPNKERILLTGMYTKL